MSFCFQKKHQSWQTSNTRYLHWAIVVMSIFVRTGREFDSRLNELGASRFEALLECDLDYEDLAAGWRERVVDGLSELLAAGQVSGSADSSRSGVDICI